MGVSEGQGGVDTGAADRDLEALRRLVDAYARAVDARDDRGFADLFAEGSSLQVIEAGGHRVPSFAGDELAGALAPLSQYEATMHLMANHVCSLDGDSASGQVYCQAQHLRRREDGKLENLHMVIRYEDRYTRTAAGWRFAERTCRILWMELHPASLDLNSF